MEKSVKNFLLETESDKNDEFAYFDSNVISKITDVDFNSKEDYILIDFSTTYDKDFKFVSKLSDFSKWLQGFLNAQEEKSPNIFYDYLTNYFLNSDENSEKNLSEIIDDTNEIMPDNDLPSNSSNSLVGVNQTMDLEKIFKKSMPKSVRNYSGNLGLGTVVW